MSVFATGTSAMEQAFISELENESKLKLDLCARICTYSSIDRYALNLVLKKDLLNEKSKNKELENYIVYLEAVIAKFI